MKNSYEINPRPVELGGWQLRLLENGEEAGGGMFPIPQEDPQTGMDWWNGLAEEQRAHWLMMAASAMPAAARHAYLLTEAYNNAQDEAESWMTTRA